MWLVAVVGRCLAGCEHYEGFCSTVASFGFYVPMTVHREQNMEREDQQDATIRCLLLTSVSTCFGHHYAHLQENKGPVTAFGVSFCNERENVDISREAFFV
jgi:hypothetical protein